jgi:hypothetical protein
MSDTPASCYFCEQDMRPWWHGPLCVFCEGYLAQARDASGACGQPITRANLTRMCHAFVCLLSHRAALLKSAGMTPVGCEQFLATAVPDGLAQVVDFRKWNCLPPDVLAPCSPACILEQSRWLRPYLADRGDDPKRLAVARVVIRGWREALWLLESPDKPDLPDEIPNIRAAQKAVDKVGNWCADRERKKPAPAEEAAPGKSHRKILEALVVAYPGTLGQYDLEQQTGLSRRTIGPSLQELRSWGMVTRKGGEKECERITLKGLAFLENHPSLTSH